MSAAQVLAYLQLLAPLLTTLEASGDAELQTLIKALPNQLEQTALLDVLAALDGLAKSLIAKV